jgi:hypothetical protein
MFEEHFLKRVIKREIKTCASEHTLSPHLELLLSDASGHYDGNTALAHQDWLASADWLVDSDLIEIWHRDPNKYSLTDIARTKSVVAALAKQGFDINCLTGQSTGVNHRKWDSTRREYLLLAILDQDHTLLSKVHLHPERIKAVSAEMAKRKQRLEARATAKQARLEQLKDQLNYSAEPMLDAELLLITTHQNSKFDQPIVVNDEPLSKLEVAWSDDKGVVELVGEDGRPVRISDRDGSIPLTVLEQFVSKEGRISIILTGGNIRGCLSETLSSVMTVVEQQQATQVDVHYPLEATYDNTSYDSQRFNRFPTKHVITRYKKGGPTACTYQTYLDGQLTDASEQQRPPVLRVYLWTDGNLMRESFLSKVSQAQTP